MATQPGRQRVLAPPFAYAAGLAIVFAGLLVYGRILGFYFTDVDTFSLIATSRFRNFEGLVGVLTSPMMKGELPNALFFRPFSSLTWAFDEWIWGLNPLGYHLTDLVIHLGNSVLVFLLVARMATWADGNDEPAQRPGMHAPVVGRRELEAFAAGLLFCLHPITVEAVAAIARRPDLLFGTFSILALLATQRRLRTGRTLDSAAIGLACVMALASKDSAVIVLPLVGLYVLFFAKVEGIGSRILEVIRVGFVPLAFVAGYIGLRAVVLGGMGGYIGSFEQSLGGVVKSSAHVFACTAVMPGQLDDCTPRLGVAAAAGVAGVIAVLALVWYRAGDERAVRRIAFAVACVVMFFVLYAATRTAALTRTIYALLPYFSMLLAWGFVGCIASLVRAFRAGTHRSLSGLTELGAAIVMAVLVGALVHGAAGGKYLEEWRVIGERAKQMIASVESSLSEIKPGSLVYTVNLPFKISLGPDRLRDHPILDDYSLQGWANLAAPRHQLGVVGITRTRIGSDQPEDVASRIRFDPALNQLDIRVGVRAKVEVCEAEGKRGERYPIRSSRESINFTSQNVRVDLSAEAFARPPVAFLVYSGGELHLKGNEPWSVEHAGVIGKVIAGEEG